MNSAKLRWMLRRLVLMSPAEVADRVRAAVRARLEQRGFGLAAPPAARHVDGVRFIAAPSVGEPEASAIVADAEAILAGRLQLFGHGAVEVGFPPEWNRDPLSGVRAPLAYGKRLDYRDERRVGNIKTLWEPSRHLELVRLAQAFALTREPRFAAGCRALVESWIAQCPYPLGVHWSSSLELAIRLLNWSVAWQLLGGLASPVFADGDGRRLRDAWVDSVFRHQHFIAGYLSRHSSANNHLLGEWMGLFVASLTWPCWPHSERWRERARAGFEAEALKQNAPDGVNREQAIYYHHEVADMMLIAGLAARAAGADFSPAFWQRLEAMMDFIVALMDAGGHVPMIGDADDALMLRLHADEGWDPYRSLVASGAVLFGRADFKAAAGAFDAKSRWLLGPSAEAAWQALPGTASRAPRRRVFDDGGYAILGTRLGEADELRLVADAGPLGYLSIAAHGHADALAFTLSVAGEELLIDPGTYAYHTESAWRDWFRGTAAHNTVRVDGADQSVIGGNFMWLRKARARLESVALGDESDRWQASHDGYRRLADPLLHRRCIEVEHAAGRILVVDTLECRAAHVAEFNWHAAEHVAARLDGHAVCLEGRRVRLRLEMPGLDAPPRLLRASEHPRGGWISRRFGVRQPTTQIVWSVPFSGTTQWKTELRVERTT